MLSGVEPQRGFEDLFFAASARLSKFISRSHARSWFQVGTFGTLEFACDPRTGRAEVGERRTGESVRRATVAVPGWWQVGSRCVRETSPAAAIHCRYGFDG